jgi:hypothetical protein
MSWAAGAFADFQSFQLIGRQFALRGDTLRFSVTLKNKGVTLNADSVRVTLQSLYAHAAPIVTSASYPTISPRQYSTNTVPFAFKIASAASLMDEMKFVAVTTQQGIETSRDTFAVIVGYPQMLFSENGETELTNWTASGTGILWDTTSVMAFRGSRSIADSRYGNVANNSNNMLTLTNPIDLASAVNPRLEFFARWANEETFDYVRLQASTNNGVSWVSLAGRHTTLVGGQPAYTSNKGMWAWEHISLAPYLGQQIRLRFNLVADAGLRGDGFYVDEFRVVDYRDTTLTGASETASLPLTFNLSQNYPNPFNPLTTFKFDLPENSNVSLVLYDLLGRKLAELVNGSREAGYHSAIWNATDAASGIYFARFSARDVSGTIRLNAVRKVLLMK